MDEQHAEHGDVFAERRDKLAAWRETGAAYPTQYQPRDEIAVAAGRLRDPRGRAGLARRAPHRRPRRRAPRARQAHLRRPQGPERRAAALLPARCARRRSATRRSRTSTSGDFVGAEGTVMRTRRGELSLRITSWQLLSKSLRPMPEKYHGLTDVETRYRKRYLDLAANDDSREVFVKRARIIAAIRRFLDDRGFIEVETPGAAAAVRRRARQARSSRTTTSSSATSTCASPPSCTSSAASSAASTASTRSARTSATRA